MSDEKVTMKRGPMEMITCSCGNRMLFYRYFPEGQTRDEDPGTAMCPNCGGPVRLPKEISRYEAPKESNESEAE